LSPTVAALDCGTNSTRMLICGPGGETVDRRMSITRLGEGVDTSRRLAPAAIERTLEVLRRYRVAIDAAGAERVMMVATSAARDAVNRDEFFGPAAGIVGVEPELLTGLEEAGLSFAGATAGLDRADGPFLVVDIGGGSTELVIGHAGRADSAVSLDMGCVRVTERFLRSDPPTAEELASARAAIASALTAARAGRASAFARAEVMIGLAGTVSAAAVLDLGLTGYDRARVHHHVLARPRVAALLEELAGLPVGGRRRRRGVEPGRADVIVGGLLVLDGVMDLLGFGSCLVSESDILDGMAARLLGEVSGDRR